MNSYSELETTISTVTINSAMLYSGIASAIHAAGKKDVRYYINGICLTFGRDTLRFTATDGHALFDVTLPAYVPDGIPPGTQAILDREGCGNWVKQAKHLNKQDSESSLEIEHFNNRVQTLDIKAPSCPPFLFDFDCPRPGKLIKGKFPDFERVIKREKPEQEQSVGIKLDYLVRADKCLKLFSNSKYRGCKLMTGTGIDCITFTAKGERFKDIQGEPIEALFIAMPMRL